MICTYSHFCMSSRCFRIAFYVVELYEWDFLVHEQWDTTMYAMRLNTSIPTTTILPTEIVAPANDSLA